MELKREMVETGWFHSVLLIVPYGIETTQNI